MGPLFRYSEKSPGDCDTWSVWNPMIAKPLCQTHEETEDPGGETCPSSARHSAADRAEPRPSSDPTAHIRARCTPMAKGLSPAHVALFGLHREVVAIIFFLFLKLELGTRNVHSKSRLLVFLRKQKSEENAFLHGIQP